MESIHKRINIARRILLKNREDLKFLYDKTNIMNWMTVPKMLRLCEERIDNAEKELEKLLTEKENLVNIAPTERIEMLAKLMKIFKPEVSDEIGKLVNTDYLDED